MSSEAPRTNPFAKPAPVAAVHEPESAGAIAAAASRPAAADMPAKAEPATAQRAEEKKAPTPNIIKTRDDAKPIEIVPYPEPSREGEIAFQLNEGHSCSWTKKGESISVEKLRSRIEPWLTALCQSEHLSLLVGSGISTAVHFMATGKFPQAMTGELDFGEVTEAIKTKASQSAKDAGREDGNIEDQIRVANELLAGMAVFCADPLDFEFPAKRDALEAKLKDLLQAFAASVLKGESGLTSAMEAKRNAAFNHLVNFLMSFASRSGTRDRLHIFTTNYDRYIEAGAELAGLHLLDRFVGSLSPIFRSSRLDLDMHYNPPGIRGEPRYLEGVARFTKLHGSLDWVQSGKQIRRMGLPFGAPEIGPFLKAHGDANAYQLMIFPNAAKDRETTAYPYVELFRDLAAAACRPNHTLVTFGYSFGDEHINRVIEDMLTIPSTHLVVISYSDSMGRIMATYEKMGRPDQITLLIGNHLGNFETLVDHYLPKSAIDHTTFRMSELLRARFNVQEKPTVNGAPVPDASVASGDSMAGAQS